VDVQTKQAVFSVKPGEKCDPNDVQKAIEETGRYTVSAIKEPTPPKKSS
jgi:hypothetical protein